MKSLKYQYILRTTTYAQRSTPAPTTFARHIRIRTSDDAEKRPPEGHVLERKEQPKNTLDPQSQSAQGSTCAPREESPANVHAGASKRGGTGGAAGGKEEAMAPSLWMRLKQMVGLSSKSSEYGGGNRQV